MPLVVNTLNSSTVTIAAGTAIDCYAMNTMPYKVRVTGVKFLPDVTSAANGTNYLSMVASVAGNAITSALTTADAALTAGTASTLTLTTTGTGTGKGRELAAGDVVKLAVTHTGTGVAGRGRLYVTVEAVG